MPKLYAVVRHHKEDLKPCLRALRGLRIPFIVVSGTTLDKASKMTLAAARITGADWVMAVDADCIITMPKKDLIEYCKAMESRYPNNLLSFTGYLEDKALGRGIITGLHFFNGKYTERALTIVGDRKWQTETGTTHRREESRMLNYLNENHNLKIKNGYKKISMGVHYA